MASETLAAGVSACRAEQVCSGRTAREALMVRNQACKAEQFTKMNNSDEFGCKASVLPEGIKEIKPYAIDGYIGLTSVWIPEGVTKIGDCAFNISI